jgi:hypothetical protein
MLAQEPSGHLVGREEMFGVSQLIEPNDRTIANRLYEEKAFSIQAKSEGESTQECRRALAINCCGEAKNEQRILDEFSHPI